MDGADDGICVIVAAYDAAATIGRAVASALAEPEVREVMVVDDASPDDSTLAAARAADDGSGRLIVARQDRNQGPSAARNRALALSSAPIVAILDADDFILPGRFARMLKERNWDMLADNIVFVGEDRIMEFDPAAIPAFAKRPCSIGLLRFVEANISRPRRPRGELGFLKPIIRREFLDAHGLHYDERMRLGEDYALYCRALAKGARFRLIGSCGYAAVERAGSLSGRHGAADLAALARSDVDLLGWSGLSPAERTAISVHHRQTWRKRVHRCFLDRKRAVGLARAVLDLAPRPIDLAWVVLAVCRDKLGRYFWTNKAVPVGDGSRFLFASQDDAGGSM